MTIYDETPANPDIEATISGDFNQSQEEKQDIKQDYFKQEDAPVIQQEKSGTLYRAAGFWIRLLAFTIDLVVIACFNGIMWDAVLPEQSFIYKIIQPNDLFLGITGLAYFILMTRYFQQTLGKMITGIQVIQRSGEPLSWMTVIFRELAGRSLSQLMGLNLGYIVCWFNGDKRCLHDFISDTWVVHVKSKNQTGYIMIDGHLA